MWTPLTGGCQKQSKRRMESEIKWKAVENTRRDLDNRAQKHFSWAGFGIGKTGEILIFHFFPPLITLLARGSRLYQHYYSWFFQSSYVIIEHIISNLFLSD